MNIMKEFTIADVRHAIAYVGGSDVRDWSDERLLKADFMGDLQMGNIRVANVVIELQRIYNVFLPVEVFQKMEDNTVSSFLKAANSMLKNQAD